MVRQSAQVENQMVSVERIIHYCRNVDPETDAGDLLAGSSSTKSMEDHFKESGTTHDLSFNNLSVQYVFFLSLLCLPF